MTTLTSWAADAPGSPILQTSDPAVIAAELAAVGIVFEQWPVRDVPAGATADEILDTYSEEVSRLTDQHGFTVVDVAQLHPSEDPEWEATAAGARGKFLAEHTHAEDEVRFFVHGAGIFYLHIGDHVHAVQCTAGDLISVPADTRHWFDMGTRPDFTAIRFFLNPDGWVGHFTGDEIGTRFPDYETLAAAR